MLNSTCFDRSKIGKKIELNIFDHNFEVILLQSTLLSSIVPT